MNRFLFVFLLIPFLCTSQTDNILSLSEYLGYVKKYHPIVKQAQLQTTESEIKLLKSRGAFDPKIEVDFANKNFKKTAYYNKLNTSFKIPTWYGIEFKANYEKNSGTYLNPEANVPDDGLYGVGISMALARGFLINDRMATLKKAKNYLKIAEATQQFLVNEIVYDAISVYFNWLKNHQIKNTYETYLTNAKQRLSIVKRSFNEGDKAAIDTLEASINLKSRELDLEKAKILNLKSKLAISNYLWLENNIPLELQDNIIPDELTFNTIDDILNISVNNLSDKIDDHSKIRSLSIKKENLDIDRKLKINNLLPTININYNFLNSYIEDISNFNTAEYKAGLQVYIPLFLRKERADYKLSKLKLQDIDFTISSSKINLSNKLISIYNEIDSYKTQTTLLDTLIVDYEKLVNAEQRMFILGEGSLFRINYREVKLIETQLKLLDTKYKFLKAKAALYNFDANTL